MGGLHDLKGFFGFCFYPAPILAAVAGLEAILTLFHDLLDVGSGLASYFNSFKIINSHGQQFLNAVTAHLAIGFIDFQQAPLRVHQPETVHCRLKNDPVPVFARFQRFLRAFALGNIYYKWEYLMTLYYLGVTRIDQSSLPGTEKNHNIEFTTKLSEKQYKEFSKSLFFLY